MPENILSETLPDSSYTPQSFLPSTSKASARVPIRAPQSQRKPLKHLLIGSPQAVRGAIHRLHLLGYAEVGAWSPLIPTTNPGEVMSILMRYVKESE